MTSLDFLQQLNPAQLKAATAFENNVLVLAGAGSGKTRTATFMLRSLAQQVPGVPMIAFDFKGDLNDERNALDKAFGATVINPLREPIPLDVFALVDKEPSTIVAWVVRRPASGVGQGAVRGPV